MNGIYGVTLRAKDGRERRELAWLPTDETRRDFMSKAVKRGLEVEMNEING